MTNIDISVLPLRTRDIDDVIKLQHQNYISGYQESREVFMNILEVYPTGGFGAYFGVEFVGYIFFHPYYCDQIKSLNNQSFTLNGDENCMYLHDICVSRSYQKSGIAIKLIDMFEIMSQANNLRYLALISVQGSLNFWTKLGFQSICEVNHAGYKDAVYMKKTN